MKPSEWRPSALGRIEREYAAALRAAWDHFRSQRARLLSEPEFLLQYARQAAARMVTGLLRQGAKTWREAAAESSRGREIHGALTKELEGPVGSRVRELVRENANLISSFPLSVARRVTAAAAARAVAGGRAEGFARGELSGIVRSRARVIARTEISKASSALVQARSENLGLDWYEWQTSGDQRVRPSHRHMQGVLVRFDAPPSPEALEHEKRPPQPYNAGNIYNCRCYPAPVVRPELLSWPHRVFYDGRIQYMTLSRFRFINQKARLAA